MIVHERLSDMLTNFILLHSQKASHPLFLPSHERHELWGVDGHQRRMLPEGTSTAMDTFVDECRILQAIKVHRHIFLDLDVGRCVLG